MANMLAYAGSGWQNGTGTLTTLRVEVPNDDAAPIVLVEVSHMSTATNPIALELWGDERGDETLFVNDMAPDENINGESQKGGARSFRIGDAGDTTELSTVSFKGEGTCHVSVASSGVAGDAPVLLAANYDSGTLCSVSIGEDGSLGDMLAELAFTAVAPEHLKHTTAEGKPCGPVESRQDGAHPHMATAAPGHHVACPDLGLDLIHIVKLGAGGALSPVSTCHLHPGAGPRHVVFHPSGLFGYVVGELDNTVTVCSFDPETGVMIELSHKSTIPEGYDAAPPFEFYTAPSHAAAILISGCGGLVLVSNRGADNIAAFLTSEGGGTITMSSSTPCGGSLPWGMSLDSSGKLLLVASQYAAEVRPPQGPGGVVPFRVNVETGRLLQAGDGFRVDLCMSVQLGAQPYPW
jgi:6-phosphogluconolactonase